ncbi:MAG: MarR family winged helix-turn-helix transcriptional regulator [Rhodospirillales bacterium]|nr:MarR family winged helix-turn-helix transcriptional regulator [Rhodospirillales bacterium]
MSRHIPKFADLGDETGLVEEEFTLERFPPYLMNRIMNRLNTNLKKSLKGDDISVAEWRVLAVLKKKSSANMSELCVYTMIEQSTLSRIVDRLVGRSLVRRHVDGNDGRVNLTSLTKKGEEAFAKIWPVARYHSARAFKKIDPDELETFIATLQKILDNVRETDFT